jgi:hypothetical protein
MNECAIPEKRTKDRQKNRVFKAEPVLQVWERENYVKPQIFSRSL